MTFCCLLIQSMFAGSGKTSIRVQGEGPGNTFLPGPKVYTYTTVRGDIRGAYLETEIIKSITVQ